MKKATKVHVESFTFGDKSKKYPYPMFREVDLIYFIKQFKWKEKFEKDYRGIAKQLFQEHNKSIDIILNDLKRTKKETENKNE